MEVTLKTKTLLREMQFLQRVVNNSNNIPILSHVLMNADGESVRFMATDLELSLRSKCSATVTGGGTVAVPARKLLEIVKSIEDEEIRFTGSDVGVSVEAGNFKSRLQTHPADDFPEIPDVPERVTAVLPSAVIRGMIPKTLVATTGEDLRYFMNGAQFILGSDSMKLVATDGHRLALVTVPREGDDEDSTVIISKKALSDLARLLDDTDGNFEFTRGENHLFFHVGDRTLIARVIDSQFPAYERVIPTDTDKDIQFNRILLMSAVQRVSLLGREKTSAVSFEFEDGKVKVSSESAEHGEANESIAVECDGTPPKILFNAQYFLDFLTSVETDEVVLKVGTEQTAAILAPVSPEGYNYTYVIMPLNN